MTIDKLKPVKLHHFAACILRVTEAKQLLKKKIGAKFYCITVSVSTHQGSGNCNATAILKKRQPF
jgi:hypothetical protein